MKKRKSILTLITSFLLGALTLFIFVPKKSAKKETVEATKNESKDKANLFI